MRNLIARDFTDAFKDLDGILAPVSPFPAFKIGEKVDDPLTMYLSDIYTLTGDLGRRPLHERALRPIERRLAHRLANLRETFDEATMFRVAYNYEQATTR